MFLTSEGNRLPLQSALVGEGATVWAVTELWSGGDALILQFSNSGDRGMPRVVMMDLVWGAGSLDQFASGKPVLRGAALLSVGPKPGVDSWALETLSEIRIGATEVRDNEGRLMQVTQFTTSEGRRFSVPLAQAEKSSRGKRIYHKREVQAAARRG